MSDQRHEIMDRCPPGGVDQQPLSASNQELRSLAGELGCLTVRSFGLDATPPTATVQLRIANTAEKMSFTYTKKW